jgi:hypothetical protein
MTFDESKKALDAAAAALAEKIAQHEGVTAAHAKAVAEHKKAAAAHADTALRLAKGESGASAAKTRQAVLFAEGDVDGFGQAMKITAAEVAEAEAVLAEARFVHSRHDIRAKRLARIDALEALDKAAKTFVREVTVAQGSTLDLLTAQRDHRSARDAKLGFRANYYETTDDRLSRESVLLGALGGSVLQTVIHERPIGLDVRELISIERDQTYRDIGAPVPSKTEKVI